jgi:SpoVK/Ycf46/Vps4 family AAA+-type ATPase
MTPKVLHYLASSNPCLFIPTIEDSKALSHIIDSLIHLGFVNRELAVWKSTTGMITYQRGKWVNGLSDAIPTSRPIMEFIGALNKVADTQECIGVFYHIRSLLDQPNIVQAIIDATYKAKQNFSTIIFIGSFLPLPPELLNIVTYVDFPLPTKDEIEVLFEELIQAWEENHKLEFPKNKKKRKEILSKAAMSAQGLDMLSAENALALAISITAEPNAKIIQSQKEQHIKKSDVLEYISTDLSLKDVGGFGALKEWLARRKDAFTDRAREYGLPWPKGILISGASGTGKSHISKCLASFLELPLLRLDMGKVFGRYVGDSEANLRRALQIVEAVAPTVVQIDEAEKALSGSEASGKTDSGVTARVLSTLLTWRQETTYPVFMVYTANNPDLIPAMIYRKGRLDEIWAVDLPTLLEREEIFKIHLERRKRDASLFDTALLANRSKNFTGAEIEASIEDAMFNAFYDNVEVDTGYILKSIDGTLPQSDSSSEEYLRLKEWMSTRARSVSGSEENTTAKKSIPTLRDIKSIKKGEKDGN